MKIVENINFLGSTSGLICEHLGSPQWWLGTTDPFKSKIYKSLELGSTTELNDIESTLASELVEKVVQKFHSLDKPLFVLYFIWCANLAKHHVQKGKQQLSWFSKFVAFATAKLSFWIKKNLLFNYCLSETINKYNFCIAINT